jgi:hypothetical protein
LKPFLRASCSLASACSPISLSKSHALIVPVCVFGANVKATADFILCLVSKCLILGTLATAFTCVSWSIICLLCQTFNWPQ